MSEFPITPDRPADRDYVTDIAVEAVEHHHQEPVVAIEYALIYRALLCRGAVVHGAVVQHGQGATVTVGLLADTAPDLASRVEGEVHGDE